MMDLVERELAPGEKSFWVEMPKPRFFTGSTIFAMLFAIPWTGFALFWTFMASKSGSLLFPLFGLPFILVGLAMLSSPLWTYRKALKTVYVITNRRAIIIEGGWSLEIRSYTADQLGNLVRREHRDGTGDVILETVHERGTKGRVHTIERGFFGISSAREVEQMLRVLAGKDKACQDEDEISRE